MVCNSTTVVTCYTTAHFAYCFHVVMLALWLSSSMASYLAFCFLSVCIVLVFAVALGERVLFYESKTGLS